MIASDAAPARWSDVFEYVLALLLPITCAGCGVADVGVCATCEAQLRARPQRRLIEATGGDVVVWSGAVFDGVPARVVRAVKEEGRTSLIRVLVPLLRAALDRVGDPEAVIVPMPTSRRSFRSRGFRVPDLLAARTGRRVVRMLRPVRRTADQRGLDREERRRNVRDSLGTIRGAKGRVILLDDVVTTGATLAEGVRALRAAGIEVVGAVTVAATARHPSASFSHPDDAFETHR